MDIKNEFEIAKYMLVFLKALMPKELFNTVMQTACMVWAVNHAEGANDNLPPGWMLIPDESDE